MIVRKIAKFRTQPSRPRRRVRTYQNSLAEEISIARGIAADPDARELTRGEIRRMRPFYEVIVMEEVGPRFTHLRAADFLRSPERDARYLDAARAAAEKFNDQAILSAAERVVSDARKLRDSKRRK